WDGPHRKLTSILCAGILAARRTHSMHCRNGMDLCRPGGNIPVERDRNHGGRPREKMERGPRRRRRMMEAQLMLRTAVVLLALTAAGGLLMAGIRFSGRPQPPNWIAMLHGLLAGSGITLVLYPAFVQ